MKEKESSKKKSANAKLPGLLKPYTLWIALLVVLTLLGNGLNLLVPKIADLCGDIDVSYLHAKAVRLPVSTTKLASSSENHCRGSISAGVNSVRTVPMKEDMCQNNINASHEKTIARGTIHPASCASGLSLPPLLLKNKGILGSSASFRELHLLAFPSESEDSPKIHYSDSITTAISLFL
jgi:hypothetical protein